jgi:hypothetical protein
MNENQTSSSDVSNPATSTESTTTPQGSSEPVEVQLEKVKANNEKLLGELIAARQKDADIVEKAKSFEKLLNTLELDPSKDVFQQLESRKNEQVSKQRETMTEAEKLRADLESTQSKVNELLEQNRAEREKNLKMGLDNTISEVLGSAGVNDKGRELIATYIKNGLQRDGDDFFALDGDTKVSVSEYAAKVADSFPEFKSATVKSGSGSQTPARITGKEKLNQAIAKGDYASAIDSLIKRK